MKRILSLLLAMLFVVVLFTACKGKGLDVVFYDYDTQEKISTINSIDNEEGVIKISDGLVGGEDCSQDINEDNAYSVLLEDPKDSTYDIWYKVVVNDEVYCKMDFSKMSEEYAQTMKDMGYDDDYYKCTGITADEFEAFVCE